MICDIQDNVVLSKIATDFTIAMENDYITRKYGIKKCRNCVNYELAYDLMNLYKRSLERDECNICSDTYCCTSQIEERIKTL